MFFASDEASLLREKTFSPLLSDESKGLSGREEGTFVDPINGPASFPPFSRRLPGRRRMLGHFDLVQDFADDFFRGQVIGFGFVA